MPVSTAVSNIYTINVAPQPNQSIRFTFYPAHPGPISIEVTTGPAPNTSTPPTYRSQGITVDLQELLPPDLAAFLSETEPETDEEPELVMPTMADLKRKQEVDNERDAKRSNTERK